MSVVFVMGWSTVIRAGRIEKGAGTRSTHSDTALTKILCFQPKCNGWNSAAKGTKKKGRGGGVGGEGRFGAEVKEK